MGRIRLDQCARILLMHFLAERVVGITLPLETALEYLLPLAVLMLTGVERVAHVTQPEGKVLSNV
jgi:hypothetical protein